MEGYALSAVVVAEWVAAALAVATQPSGYRGRGEFAPPVALGRNKDMMLIQKSHGCTAGSDL